MRIFCCLNRTQKKLCRAMGKSLPPTSAQEADFHDKCVRRELAIALASDYLTEFRKGKYDPRLLFIIGLSH